MTTAIMPYFESPTNHHNLLPRNPKETNAYLVGAGIASLAAAALLIRDAHVPGPQIHILESSKITGGSMDGAGNPDTGYVLRGGRMLNFSYVCLYDLLASIPSLEDNDETVMDEIKAFNAVAGNKTHATGRLVTRQAEYPGMKPGLADASDFEMSVGDRAALMKLTAVGEDSLQALRIQDLFSEEFFSTNFWFMFASM
jgi:oleate hydratase